LGEVFMDSGGGTVTEDRRAKAVRWVGAAFVVGTCVFGGTFALVRWMGGGGGAAERLVAVGERKEGGLSMKMLGGGQWSLKDQVGQVVVVNYFATWCGPCVEEMPGVIEVANERAGKGVVFAGVSLDADRDGRPREQTLKEFVGKMHVPFAVLLPDVDSPMFRTTIGLPQTVLIDRHGRTARTILGAMDVKELRAAIDQLVSEP
jgi:cytochrome c biogenesis protein CcmG, thiol:disulfide interchange protein DsbE